MYPKDIIKEISKNSRKYKEAIKAVQKAQNSLKKQAYTGTITIRILKKNI